MANRLPFFGDCVSWPEDKLPALHHIIEHGEDITRETFVSKVDAETRQGIERHLGYDRVFPITKDWHVAYRSVPDLGIVYMVHSGIEIVFARPEQIEKAQDAYLAAGANDAPPIGACGIADLLADVAVHLARLDADGRTTIARQVGAAYDDDQEAVDAIMRVLEAASPQAVVEFANENLEACHEWTGASVVVASRSVGDDETNCPTPG